MSGQDIAQYQKSDALAVRKQLYKFTTGKTIHEHIVDHLNPLEGARVLDIGCGYGDDLIRLAKTSNISRGVGMNIARNPLEEAIRIALEMMKKIQEKGVFEEESLNGLVLMKKL